MVKKNILFYIILNILLLFVIYILILVINSEKIINKNLLKNNEHLLLLNEKLTNILISNETNNYLEIVYRIFIKKQNTNINFQKLFITTDSLIINPKKDTSTIFISDHFLG